MSRHLPSEFDHVGALCHAEFDRLQDLLALDPARMNIERLDGYFAGLICAPVQASTGLRFGPVFGVEVFAEAPLGADAAWVEGLLWRHWCTIDLTLRAALEDPRLEYGPLLLEDATGAVAANDWARGFLRAVSEDPAAWAGFEHAVPGALDAVRRLATESDTAERYGDAERAALVAAMAAMLGAAYRHFEPRRG